MEIRQDGTMRRTKDRPLPAGRLNVSSVVIFALLTAVVGFVVLGLLVNYAAAAWGFATWAVYVLAYTPLKTRSATNTAVGAVSGALPVLIGWSATGMELDYRAWALTATLFLWQFPHFMAIAWLYRHEYDKAGFKMLTTVDSTGRRAGVQAVIAAAALVPVSLIPALGVPSPAAVWYMLVAFALGLAQWAAAGAFLLRRDEVSARRLLRASLIYLPLVLLLLLLFPWA
jgi:protoheme IX farnesyltransferase